MATAATVAAVLDLPFAPRCQLLLPGRDRLIVADAFGGKLAIVTKGETPYDGDAELKLEGEVDEELDALPAALS